MTPDEVKLHLEQGLPECSVEVTGDGSHFDAKVIGDIFAGKNTLKRHKLVYAVVNEKITSGEIHALNLKTLTPDENQ